MPALGKVGPRPGCLRGAFSSGRTGRLGRESGCGGGRGGEKVLPQGLEGARVSTAGSAPLRGGSTARAADEFSPLLAPTSYCGCVVGRGAQAPSSWCRGPGLEAPGPRGGGEGAGFWPPLALGPLPGVAGAWKLERGLSLPLPWGPPYELRPLPAGLPGAKARGFSATRCPGPILLKSPLPRRAGGWEGMAAERSFSPPQRLPFRWRRLGLHGRREPPRPLLPGRTRAEERSARTQAPAAPRPGRRPGRRGWRRSRWLQGARAAPRPGSHPFPLALARNVGL